MLVQDRYEVGEELLKCRFSTLYRCVDLQTQAPLVIRHLQLGQDADKETWDRARYQFFRESRIQRHLVHKSIPRMLDFIEFKGHFFILLEPFEGKTLDYVVEHLSALPGEKLLLRWMEQVVAGLEYLHTQDPPIVYRDLHPPSIIITSQAVINLVEFGIASLVEDQASEHTLFRGLGTLNYSAPEQLEGAPSNPRFDLYGLGATFYNLATLKPPPNPIVGQVAKEGDIRRINPAISEEFEELILQLLSPNPANRPESAAAVRRWVASVMLSQVPSAAPAFAVTPGPGPSLSDETLPSKFIADSISKRVAAQVAAPSREDAPSIERFIAMPTEEGPLAEEIAEPAEEFKPPEPFLPTADKVEDVKRKGILGNLRLPFFSKKDVGGQDMDVVVKASQADLDKFPFVDLATLPIDREIGNTIPESIAKRVQGVCIGRPTGKEIALAVKDPTQIYIFDHIAYATGGTYKPVLLRADPVLIDLASEYIYKLSSRFANTPWVEWLEKKKFASEDLSFVKAADPSEVAVSASDYIRGPVIESVDRIIKEAISVHASDIHVETFEKEVVLRYRIDGILHVMDTWPIRDAAAYVKRIKLMANMDIAQEHVPQGGRISVKVSDKEFDLRVSSLPVPDGESVVMRLLNKGSFNLKLADLGFTPRNQDVYRRLVSQPHGMVLVSGPTGSGKSTTLYATLSEINRPDRKILTCEDPIEYKMPGVVQVQVNLAPTEVEKKVTFARALREFLRQDPDVILVGEIRDDETATISVQASLTGHLVLSTIHTNDAIGIVVRLSERGVEPFMIASTLIGGVAQRLVRKICVDCKEEVPVPDDFEALLTQHEVEGSPKMSKGRGCMKCHHTGYRGRIAIYEVLEVNDTMRELITRRATEAELWRAAHNQGMTSLYHDGLVKVLEGSVSLEEVKRVCMSM